MKRLTSAALLISPEETSRPVLRLALTGSVFCNIRSQADVRWIVSSLLDASAYDCCYIQAGYDDGSTEMIPPLPRQGEWTMRPRLRKDTGIQTAA